VNFGLMSSVVIVGLFVVVGLRAKLSDEGR